MLQINYERKRFASYLREIRVELHLSIKDTAELIGIYPSRLSDYEHGKRVPTVRTHNKITDTFSKLGVDDETVNNLKDYHEKAINKSNNSTIGRIRRAFS